MSLEAFKNLICFLSDLAVFCQISQKIPLTIYSNKVGCILWLTLWTQAFQVSLIHIHTNDVCFSSSHHVFSVLFLVVLVALLHESYLDPNSGMFFYAVSLRWSSYLLQRLQTHFLLLTWALGMGSHSLFCRTELSSAVGDEILTGQDIWLPRALVYVWSNWGLRINSLWKRLETRWHCKLFSYHSCKTL